MLPDGTLFGEGIKTRIKEKLLDECNLHTIVRLPKGVFSPYTGIKTNLLFFTGCKSSADRSRQGKSPGLLNPSGREGPAPPPIFART